MRTWILGCLVLGLTPLTHAQYQASFLDNTANGGELYGISGGQQVGAGFTATGAHAMLWTGTQASQIDLHPATAAQSYAYGAGGGQQVGYSIISGNPKAMLWTGSAASAINLSPPGTTGSYAFATDGVHQVGSARTVSTLFRAVMWTGTAGSAVSLHPSLSYVTSMAEALDGGYQVGYAAASGHIYACVWNGTAASYVSIDPPGATYSRAHAISGTQVVGEAGDFGAAGQHAVLWNGFSAGSAVSLKPLWLDGNDFAQGTNGTSQVGYGISTDGTHHAIVWRGTAASAVDLNAYLPAGATGAEAWAIDAEGNIVGSTYFGALERATIWRPACVVSGDVALEDFVGDMTQQPIVVEFRNPGSTTVLDSQTVSLSASGHYELNAGLRGTYDLAFKAPHWLRSVVISVNTVGSTATANTSLANGDVDGDNEVGIGDYAILSVAYNSTEGDANWVANADLNGDLSVDIADYALLSANYGSVGDD